MEPSPVIHPWTHERRLCMVYAFFDDREEAVYVGVTRNIARRLAQHMTGPFWREVHRIETWRYDNTFDAHREELRLIAEFGPRWNIHANERPLADRARARRRAAKRAAS